MAARTKAQEEHRTVAEPARRETEYGALGDAPSSPIASSRRAAAARDARKASQKRATPAAGPARRPVDHEDPYQRRWDTRLQTLCPQSVSRAVHAVGRDAPRLHSKP